MIIRNGVELTGPTTLVHAARTQIGAAIDVGNEDYITFFLNYSKGDETSIAIQAVFQFESGGSDFIEGEWGAAPGTRSFTENLYTMDATKLRPITFDVRGIEIIKLYEQASGGTPTGQLGVDYVKTR